MECNVYKIRLWFVMREKSMSKYYAEGYFSILRETFFLIDEGRVRKFDKNKCERKIIREK